MKKTFFHFLLRLRDVLLAAIGLMVLSPVFLVIALWIRSDSEGPVFYKGLRSGKGGKVFSILKFRTMYENENSYRGPKITGNGDTRITKAGRWLRDTKLNELPQLWNLLVGEMSLVGPRPEDPDIVETWPQNVKDEILSIRPGITSPASVLYRDEETILSSHKLMEEYLGIIQPSKIRLDQLYVRHRSLMVDLDILMWTFLGFLPGLSNYKPPERSLYGGVANKIGRYVVNWFVIDFFVALLSISATGIIWRTFGPINIGIGLSIVVAFEFAIIFAFVGAVLGIQAIHWSEASPEDILDLALSTTVAAALVYLASHYLHNMPTYIITTASIMTFLGYAIARYRFRLLTGLASRFLTFRRGGDVFKERVLIIGSGDAGLSAAWLLQTSQGMIQFKVVGFVDDDIQKHGMRVRGIHVLGGSNDIASLVAEHDIGIILFAIHKISVEDKELILKKCGATHAQVVMFPNVLGEITSVVRNNGHSKSHEKKEITIPSNSKIQLILTELKHEVKLGNVDQCLTHIDEISNLILMRERADELVQS